MRGGPGRTISDPVSDDFNRVSLGANWTTNTGTSDIVGSVAWGIVTSGTITIASWAGTSLGADQVAEGTIAADWVAATGKLLAGIHVRRRSSDSARYMFGYDNDPNDSEPTTQWIMKYDGVPTESVRSLGTNTTQPAPVAGDRYRIEVRGTGATVTLKGYVNGVLVIEATDTHADRILSGPPGFAARVWVGETITYPKAAFSDFAAGTLL